MKQALVKYDTDLGTFLRTFNLRFQTTKGTFETQIKASCWKDAESILAAIKSTGEGWNAEYAHGNNPNIEEKFTEGFEEWFEQFKKK